MFRRAGPLALVAALLATALVRAQSGGATAPASGAELFPIVPGEHRVRIYQCSGALPGKLDAFFGARERVGSDEYVVYELRGRAGEASAPHTIGREWLRADEHVVVCCQREQGSITTVLDPPQRFLDFPLEPGKRWSWKGTANGLPCDSSSVAVGRERLVLPFGTIEDAWRVDTVTRGRAGDKLERSIWLAPGLGLVQEVSHIEAQGRSFGVAVKLERTVESEPLGPASKPRRRS
jgi:hypothetical protein